MNIILYVCDFFLDINECVQENICQNGGTCFNRPGSFYCSCAQGWTGTLCETGKQFHPPPPKNPFKYYLYNCLQNQWINFHYMIF